MKKLIVTSLLVLISITATAASRLSYIVDHYDLQKMNSERRCQVEECREDDFGQRFANFCGSIPRGDVFGNLSVILNLENKCYCPCSYDFVYRVKGN